MNKSPLPLLIALLPSIAGASALLYQHPQKVFSTSSNVVISEVQISGTTASDEFVELYNPTDSSVDLSGWRLSKKTATGTQSNLITTLSGTIPAQGYFLITHPTGYSGAITPNVSYSTSGSLANDNTVILYSNAGTTTVDLVGMGSASAVESAAAPNPPATQSIQRHNGQDTDNNATDFEVTLASNPQNSQFVPPASPTPSPAPSVEPSP